MQLILDWGEFNTLAPLTELDYVDLNIINSVLITVGFIWLKILIILYFNLECGFSRDLIGSKMRDNNNRIREAV